MQIASDEAFEKMKIINFPATETPVIETVAASGELQFMPKGVAAVSASVAGRVWQVTPQGKLGASVKQGDLLAIIDSVEVGKARAELLQSFAQLDSRKQFLDAALAGSAQGAISGVTVLERQGLFDEAVIRFKAAQQTLVNLGLLVNESSFKNLSPAMLADQLPLLGLSPDVAKLASNGKLTANLLPIRAPRDGVVIEVKSNEGEAVDPTKPLFVVADTTRLWLLLNVRHEDTRFLKLRGAGDMEGSKVFFKVPGSSVEHQGTLVWKSSIADEKTRTIQFAAEVPNDKQLLTAHSFLTAKIVIREEKNAVVVPSEAIHWEGDCNVVFVFDKFASQPGGLKLYHIRTVRPGVKTFSDTEIIAGLLPNEWVAVINSSALRAELLKNNLGAG